MTLGTGIAIAAMWGAVAVLGVNKPKNSAMIVAIAALLTVIAIKAGRMR